MSRGSLRLRLLLLAAAASALALAAAWIVLTLLFERHAERQTVAELERDGAVLAGALSLSPDGRPRLSRRPSDDRFDIPGGGLYWRAASPAAALQSRSLWDGALPAAATADGHWAASAGPGPFERRVVLVARRVRPLAAGPPVDIVVAADHAAVTRARDAFAGDLAASLAILWGLLVAAFWAQVRLGLKPLDEVKGALAALEADPAARMDLSRQPLEIRGLGMAVNRLADARSADLRRARGRAQDLAHALKTPLTALDMQVRELPAASREGLETSLALLAQSVRAELARVEAAAFAGPGRCEALPLVERLAAMLERTRPGGARLDIEVPEGLILPLAEAPALEVFGALMDNAMRHAAGRVLVEGGGDGGAWLSVSDDGPGIPPAMRAVALGRGARLDQAAAGQGQGQGLGLSIAADIVEASGGELTLGEAALGGLRARVGWRPPVLGQGGISGDEA